MCACEVIILCACAYLRCVCYNIMCMCILEAVFVCACMRLCVVVLSDQY